MKTGDIILIPFPFSELSNIKLRPVAIIGFTKDFHRDVIVSAISSVVSKELTSSEILLIPNQINNLRVISILKTDRIATLKQKSIISTLGKLNNDEIKEFKRIFKSLID